MAIAYKRTAITPNFIASIILATAWTLSEFVNAGQTKEEQELSFTQAGINYIPIHGACTLRQEEKVDYLLRLGEHPTDAAVKNVSQEFLKHVRTKSGEICDFPRGLQCQHRVILLTEEVDVKTLILRKNDEIDPDGGGIVVSGLDNIERALRENKPLHVLSTCRCSPIDAEEFAGECLVRAGLPCKFSSLFMSRKCVQNSACVGGIEELDAQYEGFSSWPSQYKLFKHVATRTCRCNYGFTRTSGRECLRDSGHSNRARLVIIGVSYVIFCFLAV